MKKLIFPIIIAILFASGCVKDEEYVPPVVEVDSDILLNEIMSKDPVTDLDWIELYNKSDEEVDISGYLVYDKVDPKGGFVIPEGSKIAAKGYFVLNEGDDFQFGISSGGEDVSLGKPDGTKIDHVFCPPSQADGTTFSRIPDGGETWVNGTVATKGAKNVGDAKTPSIIVDYNVAPAAGDPINVTVKYSTTETVTNVDLFYGTGDAPMYDASKKLNGVLGGDSAAIAMTGLNVANEKVSFFVAITLSTGDVYYYDKDQKTGDLATISADPTLWESYTPISGGISAPTLTLTFSDAPTAGYETVALEYSSSLNITEARIYFAAGNSPTYIKNNKVKGEDDASFTQTGVTISMANLDVEDATGSVVGSTSDVGVKISFYVRIALANGYEYYYDNNGTPILDDGNDPNDDKATDDFKADPSQWNTYTNKAAATMSSITFPANPSSTDDINVILAYASTETIVEARIYYAGTEGIYVKNNKVKGEDDASFTQTGVTINMKGLTVEKDDGTTDGTTSTSGVTIKFYARIATATSEYYFGPNGTLLAVDDSPADGAYDSSDAFKDDSSKWLSYTVQ